MWSRHIVVRGESSTRRAELGCGITDSSLFRLITTFLRSSFSYSRRFLLARLLVDRYRRLEHYCPSAGVFTRGALWAQARSTKAKPAGTSRDRRTLSFPFVPAGNPVRRFRVPGQVEITSSRLNRPSVVSNLPPDTYCLSEIRLGAPRSSQKRPRDR